MAKLTGEDQKKFLRERLEEQRHLLRKSIKEFATGDLAEAVRIAIAMRILVHETGNSKPLLKQLTSNYLELKILDRAPRKEGQGGWPTLPSSFENPEGAPSKLRLGGLVDVAISRSTPKIPHPFFITNAQ